jgi:hypothetical protein
MTTYYHLNKNKSVQICGVDEWFAQMQKIKKSKKIANTKINGSFVCTIFHGCNHNHIHEDPEIFETYIIGPTNKFTSHYRTYSTHAEALEGHKKMVDLVKNGDK